MSLLPHFEYWDHEHQSLFLRKVQQRTREILGELVDNMFAGTHIPVDRLESFRVEVTAALAEVELGGVRSLEVLRRQRGDRAHLDDWELHARQVMEHMLVQLFAQLWGDDDPDGDNGGPPATRPPNNGPSGGVESAELGQVSLGGREQLQGPVVPHLEYLGGREEVAGFLLRLARAITFQRVGNWSDDSEMTADVAARAAEAAAVGYERHWDPKRGSLFDYLYVIVLNSVARQYRTLCEHKRTQAAVVKAAERDLLCAVEARKGSSEEDPRYSDDPFKLERGDLPYREVLHRLIPRLSKAQRTEVYRYMREGTPGTPPQQNRRSRAKATMRQIVDGLPRPTQ